MRKRSFEAPIPEVTKEDSSRSEDGKSSVRVQAKPQNPFKIPTDQELFSILDKEKANKHDQKARLGETPLYMRGNTYSRKNLRHLAQTNPVQPSAEEQALAQIVLTPDQSKAKEGLKEFIAQKREIFLAQLAIDTKREELQRLERLEREEDKSLKEKEAEITLFRDQFRSFLESDGKATMEARRDAEIKAKDRISVSMKIKLVSSQISNLRNEIAHHDEKLSECQEYKRFLDSLTPYEWFKEHSSEDMYFQDPQQLLKIINRLEEENMFLIRHCQEAEDTVERYRDSFAHLLNERDGKIIEMKEKEKLAEDTLNQSKGMNDSYKTKGGFRIGNELSEEELLAMQSIIQEFYQGLGFDSTTSNDAVSMLIRIEEKLESLIRTLDELDHSLVKKNATIKEHQRREQGRQEKQKQQKQQQNEKRARALALAKQPIKKKHGRPLVPRTVPKRGESKQEKEEKERQFQAQKKADQELLFGEIWD